MWAFTFQRYLFVIKYSSHGQIFFLILNMPSKRKIVLIFTVIISIWLFSFAIHLYETQGKFRVENIPYKQIEFIEIDDRGLVGNKEIFIYNRDSIDKVIHILRISKEVEWDNINWKASKGLCEIRLHLKKDGTTTLVLSDLPVPGAILRSGDYCYRNDLLLKLVINAIKAK